MHPCHDDNKESNTDIFMKAIKSVQTFDYPDFSASQLSLKKRWLEGGEGTESRSVSLYVTATSVSRDNRSEDING